MKITIDTKEDSAEEIKKLVGFLSSFADKEVVSNVDMFSEPEVSKENILGNMFSANESESSTVSEDMPIEEPEVETPEDKVQIIY